MPNHEPLLVSAPLLEQAEQACRRRLASSPDNPTALKSLGQTLRKLGKLDEAEAVYQRLRLLTPDDRAVEYVHAILAGTDVPTLPAGMRPAPFVIVRNFLPASFHETLLPFVLSVQEHLVPARVATAEQGGAYNPDRRESLDLPGEWDVKTRFGEYVRQILPAIVPRLLVAPFEIEDLSVKVRAYLDGHFFRLHMDCPPEIERIANRRVSFTYYFHRRPRAYSGGDLLLFDTDIAANRFTTSGFTSIVPDDNTLVVFPSACYHSVVPVSCPSQAYADSRFVINGHVSCARPHASQADEGTALSTAV